MPYSEIIEIITAYEQFVSNWVIVIAIVGLALCLFGFKFKRILPFLAGLSFGYTVGHVLSIVILRHGSLSDIFVSLSNVQSALLALDFDYLGSFVGEYGAGSLVIPIISALVFACLGAILYKVPSCICAGGFMYFIVDLLFAQGGDNTLGPVIAAVCGFILAWFLFDIIFILLTAGLGAAFLGMASVIKGFIGPDSMNTLVVLAFVIGVICQCIQVYGSRKRSKQKDVV